MPARRSAVRIVRPAGNLPGADSNPTDRLLATLMADRKRWEPLVRFRVDERWYTRLSLDDSGVEAWLLTWLPGQRTGLHDHGGSAGAFGLVQGSLREDTAGRADGRPALRARVLSAGERRLFGPRHLHEIVNAGSEPAVSLHVYAPGLTRMTRYAWTTDGPTVLSVEKAGADW
jgi:predicted metal-dependent enzyme (double-stranded beta helix superfamily)